MRMTLLGNAASMAALTILLSLFCRITHATLQCERLKATMTFTQEEAPRDLSGVLNVVVKRVNQLLEGVVDVEVEWNGADLNGRVGEHIVQCRVTRLASVLKPEQLESFTISADEDGREVTSQCFHVPFTILDTNECTLPGNHIMRHQCKVPAVCVNTEGSYECLCPRIDPATEILLTSTPTESFWQDVASQDRSPWELSVNTTGQLCPNLPSTHKCCPARAHSAEGIACRAAFSCPVDPCGSNDRNDCAPNAKCVRETSPLHVPNYLCECPTGLMGNGRQCRPGVDPKPEPKVSFDGVTPTQETVDHDYYCGCTKPIVDACSGFPPCPGKHEICTVTVHNTPKCACKPGYMMHEKFGCVDETPPTLQLRHDENGDQILRLKQGDVYEEFGIDILDENAEDYERLLKFSYSQPLPSGPLTKVGEFHVNYTVATPWTSPPYARVTRRVIIDDIDECQIDVAKYEKICPSLIPQCDYEAGATCINTLGSYTCRCPKFTSGDGFKRSASFSPMDAPEGFQGGTSCKDTSKPIITLQGPNPKVFKVCACGGLSGVMGGKPGGRERDLSGDQRKLYEDDIKVLIRSTAGAELCATHYNSNPKPNDCVRAIDHTYKGVVILSSRVTIGEPVQKSALLWSVPYNVIDDAGNKATTAWRDVVVEEVDFYDIEAKIRAEIMREKDAEIKKAVEEARRKERETGEQIELATSQINDNKQRPSSKTSSCPACPKCDCPDTFDMSRCESFCQSKMESCAIQEEGVMFRLIHWLENFFPTSVASSILLSILLFGIVFALKLVLTLLLNPQALTGYDFANAERDGPIAGEVQYYRSPQPAPVTGLGATGGNASAYQPPNTAPPAFGGNGLFSPNQRPAMASPFLSPPQNNGNVGNMPSSATPRNDFRYDDDDIYETVTPSRTGDGVKRRTPNKSYGSSL